jgi:hypothetical protein
MGHLRASRTLSIEDGVWMGVSQDAQQIPHHRRQPKHTVNRCLNHNKQIDPQQTQEERETYESISRYATERRLQMLSGP